LDSLFLKVKICFADLLDSGDFFDVNDSKNSMNGKGRINKTLLQVYEENNKLTRQEEGSKYVKNTVDRCSI